MGEAVNPVYSKNVIEFITVANEYCKFMEGSFDESIEDFIDKAHKMLPLLYLKGSLLPLITEPYEEFNEKFVTESDYNRIRNSVLEKFGDYDLYEEIFDPIRQENDEPAQLSLSENLADIYQDIKDCVMQFRVGADEVMFNAIWECKQAFEQYWGQRAVNVLRVLHYLKYTVVEFDEEKIKAGNISGMNANKTDTGNWFLSNMQEDYNEDGE